MSRKTLRILCFGNSLTSGFPAGKPYAERLKEKLEDAFLGHGYGEILYEVDGVPGDLVTRGSYLGRMEDAWKQAMRNREPYDWTIVLGGTNDLGWGCSAEDLIAGLKKAWDIPLSYGGKVLALTITDTRSRYKDIKERRDEVNKAIKAYKRPNFFYFDLYNAIPYHDMVPEDRPKYWEMDGVHLSADGYNLMGEKIAEQLIRVIRLAEAQEDDIKSIAADPKQRQAIEDMIFEEERGNPKLLSQGYIVVRKSDLD
ncbi:SGNH hydrolase [Annulohypoxylon truncatum]|uniref:SGNH hydrolase n=1 Tax=Annulohypoxylon truncatum TaxID=327061 RepID=UPI0020073392|nr:SGNH hydrolase [Annulohypoxylon truncatum]KAI1214193.1 SGNH hydrolase [Annulohypoxylon truncatum]